MTRKEPDQAGKTFHHAIEITKIDIINHGQNQHGQLQTISADE